MELEMAMGRVVEATVMSGKPGKRREWNDGRLAAAMLLMGGLCVAGSAWGVLMLENPAHVPGDGLDVDLTAGAYAGNDMVSVSKFDMDIWPADYRTRSGANLGVGSARVDVGASDRGWNIGYFYRQDWLLEANRDTVDVYVLNQNDQLIGQNRSYDLNYSINGFSADGLRLGYSKMLPLSSGSRVVWGVSASLMRGLSVRQEEARGGLVSGVASGTLSGSRQLYDSRLEAVSTGSGFNDFIPPQAMDVANGLGYGMALGLTWLADNGARASLVVNDLAGRINWERVPLIEQNINNLSLPAATPGSDPAVSGRNVYKSLSVNLKPKYLLEGEYPFGRVTAMAKLEGTDGYWFPYVGLGYAVTPALRLGVEYETRFGAFGVNLRHRNYYFGVNTQNLKLADSRAIGASAGLWFSF